MDTISLKQYIYENKKIEFVLQEIGCHHIKYHPLKDYYTCANYNGDNTSAITVKNNPYLNVRNYTREKDFDGTSDIFSLVEYNKKYTFSQAFKYLHKILGLNYKREKFKPKEIKETFDGYFKKFVTVDKFNVAEIQTIDENLLNDYIPILHIDWYKEGIMPWTAKKFGLAYSYRRKRVIIPMRYWLTGELLGINSRTTVKNYKELGIKKYFITPTYQKSLNLFGYYENEKDIKKTGYVVVYESEKSVLKRDSRNDSTGVALSGHTMSDEQVSLLFRLNVDIVISMDNDIPLEEVRHICEKFYGYRNVYYTYDKWGLLGKKDSIADMSNKIYNFLFKYKIKYDEREHKEYLKSLKKKK